MKGIKKIKSWINERGYTLCDGRTDYVDYNKREMVLYNGDKRSKKHKIYTALHECGHIVIAHRASYEVDYKSIVIADDIDARHERSNVYKYKKLREEMMAWEEGAKLASKLGIKINKEDYDQYASKYWMSYVKLFAQ